ncbi:UPF0692 protein CG33108 [Cimex lectularius]|uniref:Actin maturation protease n=1 Tax=Cimex lectularius TaxID=79782 RepID=A0A8I6RKX5_CIMLE|nr:UPF0692 protein CG33108 [Cimex lectularius]
MAHSENYKIALNDIKKASELIFGSSRRDKELKNMKYTHIDPQIQIGPTCGLVALSMISSLTPVKISADELIKISIKEGFTIKGEMFSAENLTILTKKILDDMFIITHHVGGLQRRRKEIVNDLLNDTLLLVPYDAAQNHHPGCFNGHKAHWAIVCGVIVDGFNHYLIARQGKSKHVGIWRFEELAESNNNLNVVSPKRSKEEGGYIFHDIKKTLAGHYVSLKRKFI